MSENLPRHLPLRVTQKHGQRPSVVLGGAELAGVIATEGLRIEYVDTYYGSQPQVTLTFGPGSLELDFDVDLLERLLADARAAAS